MVAAMNRPALITFALLAVLLRPVLAEPVETAAPATPQRWYSAQQVELGREVYQTQCIGCHQPEARGADQWTQKRSDGSWPPPPLNGAAHAWHHTLDEHRQKIRSGGIAPTDRMPGFGTVLSAEEIDAVIAYFQSFWDDEIYAIWAR